MENSKPIYIANGVVLAIVIGLVVGNSLCLGQENRKQTAGAAQATQLLFTSAITGDIEQVKKQLANGANVNATDSQGRTALDWARVMRHTEIVNLIVKHDLESTDPPEPKHDVNITNVAVPSDCAKGDTIAVTITVANYGTFRESIVLTLNDSTDNKQVAAKTVTLGKNWN